MTEITEHRPLEELKKELNSTSGTNVVFNWKDALYLGCYIDTLEKHLNEKDEQLHALESLLQEINDKLSSKEEGEQ